MGATDPPVSFDRGWGFLKVCASLPLPPPLFPCACRKLLYSYLSFLVKDACPPHRRGRRHNRGRPNGIPPSPPSLPLLCSCPLSALAHDTYLPFSFLFVKPPLPLHSSFSCPLVLEGNDASSNHLEYGWNRCWIHSEGCPPSLFVKPPFPLHSSFSCPLVLQGNDASSNHLEYGWNRCWIHSEGCPPSLFCLGPAFLLSFPLIMLGEEAT